MGGGPNNYLRRVGRSKSVCRGRIFIGSQHWKALGTFVGMNILFVMITIINIIQQQTVTNTENMTEMVREMLFELSVITFLMVLSNIYFCRAAFRSPGVIPKIGQRTYTESMKFSATVQQENRLIKNEGKLWYFQRVQGQHHSTQIVY